jgi:ATP-binding protein involved in chromosome partitioning
MTSNVRGAAPGRGIELKGVKNAIAVASGKGGVGKSTVAANLALALKQTGAAVGLMDADVYGPSLPLEFGISGQPEVTDDRKIVPKIAHGLQLMSMGFLANESTPIIWRGPMVHGLIQQFLGSVLWGNLDYLIIDCPPGTGDAILTLTQTAPLAGAVIVTTPQDMSLIDARRGLKMFQNLKVPVLGIVENMSYFACRHCGEKEYIFSRGGGSRLSKELGVPLLGEIPLDPEVVAGSDSGTPILIKNPAAPASAAYRALAGEVARQLSILSAETAPGGDMTLTWR